MRQATVLGRFFGIFLSILAGLHISHKFYTANSQTDYREFNDSFILLAISLILWILSVAYMPKK